MIEITKLMLRSKGVGVYVQQQSFVVACMRKRTGDECHINEEQKETSTQAHYQNIFTLMVVLY